MNSQHKITFSAAAKIDLRQIRDFMSAESIPSAIRILKELSATVQTLDIFPERCPVIPELVPLMYDTYRHLIHKPYRIIFAIRSEQVIVMRIIHGARPLDPVKLELPSDE